jgi:hypothetical protein
MQRLLTLCCAAVFTAPVRPGIVWIEAEHLEGIKGYCWPMGRPEMKKTAGHWGLSGPGWAAEWNQGGESGFLSIAAAGRRPGRRDDDGRVACRRREWHVWARYGDWREAERFQIKIEQNGAAPWTGSYGENPVVEEDREATLYGGWALGWDRRSVKLKKGSAKLGLVTSAKGPEPRQVDVLVLTTDPAYRPRIKERPRNHAWEWLEKYRKERPADLEPLARNKPSAELPAAWKLHTFKDKGFRYL